VNPAQDVRIVLDGEDTAVRVALLERIAEHQGIRRIDRLNCNSLGALAAPRSLWY
jgi:hypothetical protein